MSDTHNLLIENSLYKVCPYENLGMRDVLANEKEAPRSVGRHLSMKLT